MCSPGQPKFLWYGALSLEQLNFGSLLRISAKPVCLARARGFLIPAVLARILVQLQIHEDVRQIAHKFVQLRFESQRGQAMYAENSI
mgnify:CR=1 FL=1